jgi:hypothetical protein
VSYHGLSANAADELLVAAIDRGLRAAVFARARREGVDPVTIADALADALPQRSRARQAALALAKQLRPGMISRATAKLRKGAA